MKNKTSKLVLSTMGQLIAFRQHIFRLSAAVMWFICAAFCNTSLRAAAFFVCCTDSAQHASSCGPDWP